MNETIAIAVLAKAPLPGFAKTRLIPALGAEGAALLQARLVEHSVATACAARIGPVTLWGAPDESHPLFQAIGARLGVTLARQDGGYALIGLRAPARTLFSEMHWSVPSVMEETRRRLRDLGMRWQEPVTLWDLDLPEDIERLRQIGLHDLIPSANA